MYAVKTLRQQLGELLAADATTLAPAVNANEIHLVTDDFVPSDQLVLADFNDATFTGSTAKDCGTGTQNVVMDPASGDQLIVLKEPAGGWLWECTAAPAAPEIITGIILTTDARAALLGMMRLPENVTIQNVGDGVLVGAIILRIPFNTLHS